MKNKTPFTLMIIVLLALIACNPTGGDEPVDGPVTETANLGGETTVQSEAGDEPVTETANLGGETTVQSEAGTAVDELSAVDCPEATPGTHQLIDAARGICFLYPSNSGAFVYSDDSGFTLYVRSLMGNHESPVMWFTFEPANGRSLEEVTTQRLADYAFPETQSQAITLGGEPASMLDNLPGQDTNRRVVVVHDDRVIDFVVDHIGKNYGPAGEQAEAAYSMITGSFQFIGVDPEAPLVAGPECPEPVEDSMIYTNEPAGFCLLLPSAYTVQTIDPEASEIAFFVSTIQDVTHARLFITVQDADGRSLQEVTAAKEAEIETAISGLDVMWSFGYELDGVPANQFDQVPGQDLGRQVVTVHDDRLYTLIFIPDDPTADAYAEMQILYNMVMETFSFMVGD